MYHDELDGTGEYAHHQIDEFLASMAGAVQTFARTTAPDGWLECDGSAVSRTAYSRLYAAIGTTFGSGDGSTTFNLPDLRGRVAVGSSTAYSVAATGGTADAVTVAHTHVLDASSDSAVIFRNAGAYTGGITWNSGGTYSYDLLRDYSSQSAGVSGSGKNMQPYVALLVCIRT